ncbi:MAG TPA: S9 family peptidase [Thermomicrobiales bacterium]|jgi:dipeptidyl aminopeptidase/acylaminoacyl peptidase|nr:S9 family peptidase [Thermomicrobiales bacterium]
MATTTRRRTGTRYSFEQFTAIRRYQPTLTFSPDGREIAYVVNTSGQFNIWRQSSAGGFPHQLTLFTDQTPRDISWSPDGQTIAFAADRDGDEYKQIYTIPARGGRISAQTEAPRVRHELAPEAWSPDGTSLLIAGNDRSETDQDVMIRDLATGETRRVVDYGGMYFPVTWAPDGKSVTVVDFKSNTNMDLYVLTVDNEEMQHLTPHEGEIQYLPGPWAADGSGFYVISDEGREFAGLAFWDLKEGMRWVDAPDADVENVALSGDGRYLAWIVNQEGYSALKVRDLRSNRDVALPEMPKGVIDALTMSHSGGMVGFLMAEATHPHEVYVLDLERSTLTRLTESMLGGIDEADLSAPELIHYPTHDGRKIPAWLYRPEGDGPFPVILSIHGGPEWQERPTYNYSGLYQYLLTRGIGILAPNVRGSTGYGKSYQKLIHHDWGGAELGDFKAAADYLKGLDWVDGDRLGVYGGSFGGFATLSCLTRLPDYWAAAVDIVGPSNLVTFAKAVPPTWRRFMDQWVGNPETEVDFLMERSPITYVDQVTAPLFVIQGANDPRVVQNESDQIVERLRARGVEVKYDVYEDEGHGFTRRSNELKALGDTAGFFETHLLGAEA